MRQFWDLGISKSQKLSITRFPSAGGWINEVWQISKLNVPFKVNELQLCVLTWKNFSYDSEWGKKAHCRELCMI